MSSEIRVNKINNRAGLGTVEYTPTGIIVSGIVTAYEFDGNFDTTPGIVVTGIATAAGIDLNGDLDVDGHTNLDNVSIAGVTTFSGVIGGTFDVDGHTNLDNVNISGMTTTTGNLYLDGGNINIGTGVTIKASGEATYLGIVTASAFKLSDGSNVGGVESDAQGNTVGGTNSGDSFSGTDAIRNTLYGYDTGTAITSADRTTAVGYHALKTVSTNNNNSAFGDSSLRETTGQRNNAFGNNAGIEVTSGSDNCFFGSESGAYCGSSTRNTGVGNDSLYRVGLGGEGNRNTGVGYKALYDVRAGDENTSLGYQAGDNINGSNNIVIGANADASSSSVSNEITLGDSNISLFRVPGINLTFGNNGAVIAGVVTATSFSGDGSSLSNLPAGAPVGGASTNTVFFENDKAVAVNYQVTSTKNAMSAGPIAINAGIAVTVPSGSSWTIV